MVGTKSFARADLCTKRDSPTVWTPSQARTQADCSICLSRLATVAASKTVLYAGLAARFLAGCQRLIGSPLNETRMIRCPLRNQALGKLDAGSRLLQKDSEEPFLVEPS